MSTGFGPMACNSTVSERWRFQGNSHFQSYKASTNFVGKKHHLENAIQSYSEAYKASEHRNEKCSACKNYGTAAWHLVGILREISRDQHRLEIESRLLEAIEYLGKGLSYGAQFKDANWADSLTALYVECVEDATTVQLKNLSCKEKVIALEKYVSVMLDDSHRGRCFFELASLLFFKAIESLASKDYKRALNALNDCHRPIHECLRLCRGDDRMLSEVSIIHQDVGFQMATAESLQAIDQGDSFSRLAVDEDEGICMDYLYGAMDWYKKAIILTREVEVEMEACALSHLGNLYDKVLKMKSKAKDYFMRCMQLAMSIQPRNLHDESWFRTCAEALQRYQQESLVDEQERKQAEREDCLKELQNEIADLSQADVGSDVTGFLKHVYATYPPKNSKWTLDLSQGPKKALLKSITHYHPDKQSTDADGVKWSVLCDEIVKLMTRRYETYKFDPTTPATAESTEPMSEEGSEQPTEQDSTNESTETMSEEGSEQSSEQDPTYENRETMSEEGSEQSSEQDSTDENTETMSEEESEQSSEQDPTDENTETMSEEESEQSSEQDPTDDNTESMSEEESEQSSEQDPTDDNTESMFEEESEQSSEQD